MYNIICKSFAFCRLWFAFIFICFFSLPLPLGRLYTSNTKSKHWHINKKAKKVGKTNPETSKHYGNKKRAKNCRRNMVCSSVLVVHFSPFKCKYRTISSSVALFQPSQPPANNNTSNFVYYDRTLCEWDINNKRMSKKSKERRKKCFKNQHSKNLRAFVPKTAIKIRTVEHIDWAVYVIKTVWRKVLFVVKDEMMEENVARIMFLIWARKHSHTHTHMKKADV